MVTSPIGFGASGSSESVRPRSWASCRSSPSTHPPPTTFLRKARPAHHPRNRPNNQSPLADSVASHHFHGRNRQRPAVAVDCQSSAITIAAPQAHPRSSSRLSQDRSHESRFYCYGCQPKPYTCSHPPCRFSPPGRSSKRARGPRTHPRPHTRAQRQAFRPAERPRSTLEDTQWRAIDGCLNVGGNTVNNGEPEARRRRGGEHGRDWICDFEGCTTVRSPRAWD